MQSRACVITSSRHHRLIKRSLAILQKADNLLLNLDYVVWSFVQALGMTIDSHCDLETIDDAMTVVGKDGSLGTLIRINGILH